MGTFQRAPEQRNDRKKKIKDRVTAELYWADIYIIIIIHIIMVVRQTLGLHKRRAVQLPH